MVKVGDFGFARMKQDIDLTRLRHAVLDRYCFSISNCPTLLFHNANYSYNVLLSLAPR